MFFCAELRKMLVQQWFCFKKKGAGAGFVRGDEAKQASTKGVLACVIYDVRTRAELTYVRGLPAHSAMAIQARL